MPNDELLLSRDRPQGGHMASEGWALRPEKGCEMHSKASLQAKLNDNEW